MPAIHSHFVPCQFLLLNDLASTVGSPSPALDSGREQKVGRQRGLVTTRILKKKLSVWCPLDPVGLPCWCANGKECLSSLPSPTPSSSHEAPKGCFCCMKGQGERYRGYERENAQETEDLNHIPTRSSHSHNWRLLSAFQRLDAETVNIRRTMEWFGMPPLVTGKRNALFKFLNLFFFFF